MPSKLDVIYGFLWAALMLGSSFLKKIPTFRICALYLVKRRGVEQPGSSSGS